MNSWESMNNWDRRQWLKGLGAVGLGAGLTLSTGACSPGRPGASGKTAMHSARTRAGVDVPFQVFGSGPTVLIPFSPEPSGDRTVDSFVRLLIDGLADRFRLVMIDMLPLLDRKPFVTPDTFSAAVLDIADAADAPRFAWYGYSWFAGAGVQLAVRTDRLTGLVCGGWAPIDSPYRELLRDSAPGTEMYTWYGSLLDFDDRAAQKRIACPRLCYIGSKDRTVKIGDIVKRTRSELEALGWEVRILDGLNHNQALLSPAVIPLLREWFATNLPAAT